MKVNVNTQSGDFSLNYTSSAKVNHYDKAEVLTAVEASGRALDVLAHSMPVDPELLKNTLARGKEAVKGGPCPICGGTDRFKIMDVKTGACMCRKQCPGSKKGHWELIDLVMAYKGWTLDQTLTFIGDYLGATPSNSSHNVKPSAGVERVEEFEQFEPSTAPPEVEQQAPKKGYPIAEGDVQTIEKRYKFETYDGAETFVKVRQEYYSNGQRVSIRDARGKVSSKNIYWAPSPKSRGFSEKELAPYRWTALNSVKTRSIHIVEGENCAEVLQPVLDRLIKPEERGAVIVSTAGSAGDCSKWVTACPILAETLSETISETPVYIYADNDSEGEKAARSAAKAFIEAGFPEVKGISFAKDIDGNKAPSGYDIGDYLEAVNNIDRPAALRELLQNPERVTLITPEDLEAEEDAEEEARNEARTRAAVEERKERQRALDAQQTNTEQATATVNSLNLLDLPECIRGVVSEHSDKFHSMESTEALVALTVIGAFSGYKFKFCDSISRDSDLYLNLAFLGVGESSAGKSPLYNFYINPVQEYELAGKKDYHIKLAAVKKLREEIAQAKKQLKAIDLVSGGRKKRTPKTDIDAPEGVDLNAEDDLNARRVRLEELVLKDGTPETMDPEEPAIYLLNPKSPEGIKAVVAHNLEIEVQEGALVATDEATSILSARNGEDSALDRFGQYSQLYDGCLGNDHTITTGGVGKQYSPELLRVGYLLFNQPKPTARLLQKEIVQEQGFYNRLIRVYIPYLRRGEYIKPVEISPASKNAFKAIFSAIVDSPARTFEFNEDARELFDEYRRETCDRAAEAREKRDFQTAAFTTKLNDIVIKLACLLRLGDYVDCLNGVETERAERAKYAIDITLDCGIVQRVDAPDKYIDRRTLERAIRIAELALELSLACDRYLLETPLDALGPEGKTNVLKERLLAVIASTGAEGATASTIQRAKGLNPLKNKAGETKGNKLFKKLIEELIDLGQVQYKNKRYFKLDLPAEGDKR